MQGGSGVTAILWVFTRVHLSKGLSSSADFCGCQDPVVVKHTSLEASPPWIVLHLVVRSWDLAFSLCEVGIVTEARDKAVSKELMRA